MNMRFWGSTLARNVPARSKIYADILLRPHLPEEELEPIQAARTARHSRASKILAAGQVMVELRRRYYPPPLNKDRRGLAEDIESLTIDAVRGRSTGSSFGRTRRFCRWRATSSGSR